MPTETTIDLDLEVSGCAVRGVLQGTATPDLPVVVYLHGFGSTASGTKGEFFSQRFLARGLNVCRFDLRGHGRSQGRLGQATVERNLADLEAVLADLGRRGYKRYLLSGSSYGALTCLARMNADASSFAGGVFIAPAIGMAASIEGREGAERLALWQSAGAAPLAEDPLGLSWDFYQDALRWTPASLSSLEPPCLLFHGMRDDEIDWAGVHDLATHALNIELHLFRDGDHRLLEFLDQIWIEIDDFLTRRLGIDAVAPQAV